MRKKKYSKKKTRNSKRIRSRKMVIGGSMSMPPVPYTDSENIRNRVQSFQDNHNQLKSKYDELSNKITDIKEGNIPLSAEKQEELENAIKLHDEINEIMKNPILIKLYNDSTKNASNIILNLEKGFFQELSGAASSIPFVGELFVAERMVKNGMETVNKVEESVNNIATSMNNVAALSNSVATARKGGKRIYASIGGFLESSRLG
jgi:uncharacterized protein YdcH (DUF465 family)